MADETVELVGGPKDGQRVRVAANCEVWLVAKPPPAPTFVLVSEAGPPRQIVTGTYRRRLGAFEWDGWDDENTRR